MQIRTRLTFQFTIVVSTLVLGSFIALYLFAKSNSKDEFRKRLREKAITSAILLLKVEEVDSALLKTIDLSKHDILFKENISIFDDLNNEIYTNNDNIKFKVSIILFKKIRQDGRVYFSEAEFDIVGVQFKHGAKSYCILAGAIDVDGDAQLALLKRMLISLSFIMIVIVGVAGWFYADRALEPIKKVMDEVQEISTIDLSQRLHGGENPDEIGNLISIFNGLLSRIENAFLLQKTFVTNVSHELKNPLTKITSQLEVILLNDRTDEEYRATIRSVLDDIKELNHLSTSLLDLASLNQSNRTFAMTNLRIDEVLWEVRERIQAMFPAYKVNVHTVSMPDKEEDLYLMANPYLLKTAIQNLIENACKFSNDQTATVSLICSPTELEVRVFDNGPGIAEAESQNIFQPFYRANNTSQIKGYGIGLSLSQKIISIHNGTIEIDSMVGQGTQVIVIFRKKL